MLLAALLMGSRRRLVRVLGMRVRGRRMFVRYGVIVLAVMLGRSPMRLRSRLVMIGSLCMIVLCHDFFSREFIAYNCGSK